MNVYILGPSWAPVGCVYWSRPKNVRRSQEPRVVQLRLEVEDPPEAGGTGIPCGAPELANVHLVAH